MYYATRFGNRGTDYANSAVLLLCAALSIILNGVGVYLSVVQQTAAAAACFTFGFLVLILSFLSKFKRFRGFGVEMEMWEQEKIKAEQLIRELKSLSTPLIGQLALFAATFGLQNQNLTIEQKEELLGQLQALANDAGFTDAVSDKMLRPLYERLCRDYCWYIDWMVEEEFRGLHQKAYAGDPNALGVIFAQSALHRIDELKKRIWSLDSGHMEALLELVSQAPLPEGDRSRLGAEITRYNEKFAQAFGHLP